MVGACQAGEVPVRQTEFVHSGESLLYDSDYFLTSVLLLFLLSSLPLSLQWVSLCSLGCHQTGYFLSVQVSPQ